MTYPFFSGWSSPIRILIVGILAYLILILLLRFSGKRALGKMNAFDLVVTVALGSTLATTLVSASVPLFDGVVALGLLIVLQFIVVWASLRWARFRAIVKSKPRLLVRNGVFLGEAMERERVDHDEVLAAIRKHGIGALADVAAVVLETDGSFSVLESVPADAAASSLSDVEGVVSSKRDR